MLFANGMGVWWWCGVVDTLMIFSLYRTETHPPAHTHSLSRSNKSWWGWGGVWWRWGGCVVAVVVCAHE
jgi:hypothetical protein